MSGAETDRAEAASTRLEGNDQSQTVGENKPITASLNEAAAEQQAARRTKN